ncbi:hypothetical protein D9M72_60690 [compost metagenome]
MANARTYFQSRLPPGELARILLRHERFFLENVGDMSETVAALLSASALAGPRADLIITLRSNSLLEVCYRRSAARA